tara:strand:+ start:181 stop:1050 length:870 start_codon:yes stop_codon:yes gene_type:complete
MSISSIPDTNDIQVFQNKMIIIPDYVIPSDMPKIYHYFDYYNIASIKNVEIKQNIDITTTTGYIYSNEFCHAIIEVDEWCNNNSAYWFYQAIENNNCKMVYDDPSYWDVEFYVKLEEDVEQDYEYKNEVSNQSYENYEVEVEDEVEVEVEVEDEDEEVFDYSYTVEQATSSSSEFNSDSYSEYESGSEADNSKDKDYNLEESENEEDVIYEYYKMDHNKSKHFTYSKSKKENKKRKFSVDAQKEIEQLKEENDSLKALLIKNNKNYLKNNKTKSFKNDWSRRLRQKVSY